jgi:hypothetical protein
LQERRDFKESMTTFREVLWSVSQVREIRAADYPKDDLVNEALLYFSPTDKLRIVYSVGTSSTC